MENPVQALVLPSSTRPTILERVDAQFHAFVSMDAIPSFDSAEHDLTDLLFDVEKILQAETYGSKFTKAIADRFQHDARKARSDFYVRVSLVATLIYVLFLFADAFIIPDVIGLAILLQLGIGTPAAIVAIWAVATGRSHPTGPTAVVLTVMVLTSIALFSVSRAHNVLLFAGVFPLYLIAVNVGLALPFRPALALTVLYTAAFTIAICLHPSLDGTAQLFLFVTLSTTATYSVVGNFRIEASFRRAYLHTLKESLRSHILARTNSELETMAHVDGLTGIGNRRHFDETIQRIWREARTDVAILLIDIDLFKTLNDTYGHKAGDLYLCGVAQTLANGVKDVGTVVRYGGEEFIVTLPDSSADAALIIAENLRRSVEALTMRFDDTHDLRTTISIGCAVCRPSSTITASDVVAAADTALYQAKASGRNRTRLFSSNFSIAA